MKTPTNKDVQLAMETGVETFAMHVVESVEFTYGAQPEDVQNRIEASIRKAVLDAAGKIKVAGFS